MIVTMAENLGIHLVVLIVSEDLEVAVDLKDPSAQ